MKYLQLLIVILSLNTVSFATDAKPVNIAELVGKYYRVENNWAGEEISFVKENGDIMAVWRICGSGLPYVGWPYKTKIALASERQAKFKIVRGKVENEIIVSISEQGIHFYLDGIRFYATEYHPLPHVRDYK